MAQVSFSTSAGILIDVQEFFLTSLGAPERGRIERSAEAFLALLGFLKIPTLVTLERPVSAKGTLPPKMQAIARSFDQAVTIEKDFFGLMGEATLRDHLAGLGRRQMIVAGCETDVCVLQSTLGLIEAGYEVFVVEDLLFSSSPHVSSAIDRMKRTA